MMRVNLALSAAVRTYSTHIDALSNGVRVATSPLPGEASTVGVFVNAGSSFDAEGFAGTSSVLGRIAAAESCPEEGVILSSFVDREQMGIVAHGEDPNKNVEVLAKAVKAMGEGKGLDAARSSVLAEHDAYTLQSEPLLFDHLHSIAFQTTPLGAPNAGTSTGVNAITPATLENYMNTHFTGQRVVVAGAGNVSQEDLKAASMSAFGSLPESSSFGFASLPDTEYTGSAVTLRDESYPTLCAVTAFKGVGVNHPDALKQKVVAKLLGNWNRNLGDSYMTSYSLSDSVIDEGKKSASLIKTFSQSYRSTGIIGALSHSDRMENEDVIYFVCKEFVRIAHEVPTTEVKRAKAKVLREALATSNSPYTLAKDMGLQLLQTGSFQSPEDLSAAFDAISRDDVRKFAADNFTDTDPAVVGTGPTVFFPDFNMIRSWTYQNRL